MIKDNSEEVVLRWKSNASKRYQYQVKTTNIIIIFYLKTFNNMKTWHEEINDTENESLMIYKIIIFVIVICLIIRTEKKKKRKIIFISWSWKRITVIVK